MQAALILLPALLAVLLGWTLVAMQAGLSLCFFTFIILLVLAYTVRYATDPAERRKVTALNLILVTALFVAAIGTEPIGAAAQAKGWSRYTSVPMFLAVAAIIALPLLLLSYYFDKPNITLTARCPGCDAELTGASTQRCPECGFLPHALVRWNDCWYVARFFPETKAVVMGGPQWPNRTPAALLRTESYPDLPPAAEVFEQVRLGGGEFFPACWSSANEQIFVTLWRVNGVVLDPPAPDAAGEWRLGIQVSLTQLVSMLPETPDQPVELHPLRRAPNQPSLQE